MVEVPPAPEHQIGHAESMAERTYQEAVRILHDAVAGTTASAWGQPSPCAEWSTAQVAQHAAMDQLLYVASITGTEKPEGDAFAPTGVVPGTMLAFVDDAIARSRDAFATVAPDAEGVGVPLPPFSVPAGLAFGAAALDAAVHGWDIAVASGQSSPLSDALARELLAVARQLVEPVRAWGAYAAALEVPDDADDVTRLLAYLGRRPDWTPPS
jgi:uncharacterized protein (TIGR03086 family)